MTRPAMTGWSDTHWFCSNACLSAWLDAMPPAAAPSPGVVFTCGQCETEILLKPGEEWPVWMERKEKDKPARRSGFCSTDCMVAWMSWYETDYWGSR